MNDFPPACLGGRKPPQPNAQEVLSVDTCRSSTATAEIASCWMKYIELQNSQVVAMRKKYQVNNTYSAKMRLGYSKTVYFGRQLSCGRDRAQNVPE